jgi:predicted DNA-binding transcriptional regulator AlpA
MKRQRDLGPRYLDTRAVATYLSVSRYAVAMLVSKGRIPKPIELAPRLKRWDREAIDAALAGTKSHPENGPATRDLVNQVAHELAQGRPAQPKAARRR